MSIDIYQQCPCHEEKKIKFCCGKGVVDDLNQALSKHYSGQSQAALEQLERAIESMGDKDCLTTLKTFVQIAVQDIDGAEATNNAFMERCPEHPTGLQHRALIEVMRGETAQATLTLQDAMDGITGSELPVSLARPFESIGMAFVASKNIYAARAHLSFALFLKGEDPQLSYLLRELYNPSGGSLFLKANHQLDEPEKGAEWEKQFTNVHRAIGRGQFRRGLGMLLQLSEQYPETPAITKGIAVLTSMFAPLDAQLAAWRNVASMSSTSEQDAIEFHGLAESIAQISDAKLGHIPVNRCAWEIEDFESVKESCISSDLLVPMEQPPGQDPFNEGPAPRAGYLVLDKPKMTSAETVTLDSVPFALGELLLYGKQTDRSARVELVCVENGQYSQALELAAKAAGVSGDPKVTAFESVNAENDAITWNWKLHEEITREQHEALLVEMKKVALDRWLNVKHDFAGGKSVREAAADVSLLNWVQAKMANLEQTANGEAFSTETISEVRKELGVTALEPLVPAADESLTPMQMCWIDAAKIDDDQLVAYFEIATIMQNFLALRKLTPEVLKREHIEGARRDICHVTMARFAKSHDEALEHFSQSRAEAAKLGMPVGVLLVAEFEYRLRNGLQDKLDSLLQTIESRHMDEPGVESELGRLFQSLGIQPGAIPGDPQQQAEQAVAQTAASESGDAASSETSSGLWIPD